jgi:hypothetical protein
MMAAIRTILPTVTPIIIAEDGPVPCPECGSLVWVTVNVGENARVDANVREAE